MKNQYNFLKSIDTSTTTTSTSNKTTSEDSKSNTKLPLKASLSKLHNLVVAKLTSTATSSSASKQQQQRNARLSTDASDNSSKQHRQIDAHQVQQQEAKQKSVSQLHSKSESQLRARQDKRPKATERLQQDQEQQQVTATRQQRIEANMAPAKSAAAGSDSKHQQQLVSEKITPELAKCYDEIDQIYDYIRGLAPLPLQLRKIKSIDFEQMEREKRQQQLARAKALARAAEQTTSESVWPPTSTNKAAKVRQRDAASAAEEAEQLKGPNERLAAAAAVAVGPSSSSSSSAKQQQLRIQGPLPIKVTTTSQESRPNVKRVESLNLGALNSAAAPLLLQQQQSQQSYLISAADNEAATGQQQQAQLFRLPRAHSTSTLNKQSQQQTGANKNISNSKQVLLRSSKQQRQQPQLVTSKQLAMHTLPALRLSRVSMLEPTLSLGGQQRQATISASLGRPSRMINGRQVAEQQQEQQQHSNGKQLDLVESFVDDGASSSESSSSSSSSSASASSSSSSSSSSGSSSSSSSDPSSSTSDDDSTETTEATTSDNEQQQPREKVALKTSSSSTSNEKVTSKAKTKTKTRAKVKTTTPTGSNDGQFGSRTNLDSPATEKWAEKSHSDYENETVSLSSSSAGLSDLAAPVRRMAACPANKDSSNELALISSDKKRRQQQTLGSHASSSSVNRSKQSAASNGVANKQLRRIANQTQGSEYEQEEEDADDDDAREHRYDCERSNKVEEHIYEQIPAHKNMLAKQQQQQESLCRPHSMPHNHQLLDNSYNKFRQRQQRAAVIQQQQQQQLTASPLIKRQPYNYPVAYAPSVAQAIAKQQRPPVTNSAFLARPVAQSPSMHNLAQLQGTYPLTLAHHHSHSPHPIRAIQQQQPPAIHHKAAMSLDPRHRLSMNSLHLLPYVSSPQHPLVVYQPSGPDPMTAKLSRSSSSSKLTNRAPRLSPGQLIAQIQMPRAISKRQQQQHEYGSQFQPNRRSVQQMQQQPVFLWDNPRATTAAATTTATTTAGQAAAAQLRPAQSISTGINSYDPKLAAYYGNAQPSAASKRNSGRRLTAIGIEEALECVRQAQSIPTQQRAQLLYSNKPLDSAANSRIVRSNGSQQPQLLPPTTNGAKKNGYFEPPQMVRAPFLDDDSDGHDSNGDNDEGDEDDDDKDDVAVIGPALASSDEMPNSPNGNGGQKERPLLAYQQAAAFIQRRCLNSISRSPSSSSSELSHDNDDHLNRVHDERSRPSRIAAFNGKGLRRAHNDKTSAPDDGNFVSSRSFIKCYYGREVSSSSGKQAARKSIRPAAPVESQYAEESNVSAKQAKTKRRSGEKLLSLIGFSTTTATNQSSAHEASPATSHKSRTSALATTATTMAATSNKQASKQKSEKRHDEQFSGSNKCQARLLTSPIAAMFAASQQQPTLLATSASAKGRQRVASATLMGEFLNSEGPILVRDRRLAALRPDLVRHYEHPTVQVAEVPSYVQKHHHHYQQQQQQQQQQRALAQVGSTNTTNSTSSYEAAIKNSRELGTGRLSPLHQLASSEQQARKASSSATSGGGGGGGGSSSSSSTNKGRHHHQQSASSSSLIKVPKLSKQSHLLNRPLPKPPTSGRRATQETSGQQRNRPLHQVVQQEQPTRPPALTSKRKMLFSTNLDSSASSSHPFQLTASSVSAPSGQIATNSKSRASNKSVTSSKQSAVSGSGGGCGSSSLSPLGAATQPSPTVTTYTSSGISSRLTAGTHLASNASSWHSANNIERGQRAKSSSSSERLQGASTGPQQQQQTAELLERHNNTKRELTSSNSIGNGAGLSLGKEQGEDFALMDDSDARENSRPTSAEGIAGLMETNLSSSSATKLKGTSEALTNLSNLRQFDERFSAKFMDQQLASSNDSLLESINFSSAPSGGRKAATTTGQRQYTRRRDAS